MFTLFAFIYICHSGKSYGVELELTNFSNKDNNNGFTADFVLNTDVNYYIFGLFKVGDKEYNDKLVLMLNNEFSLNSSQKKGNSFNITRDMDLRRLATGTFYFQLESQDGMVYKSNQFHHNPKGGWLIKRPIGSPILPVKEESFLSKYKYFIIGTSIVIAGVGLLFVSKVFRKKPEIKI